MSLTFEPRKVLTQFRGEEISVQSLSNGQFELCVTLNKEQYTYLEITRDQLEQVRVMLDAALLESSYL